MKPLPLILLASFLATPVLAQHAGHGNHPSPSATPRRTDPHAGHARGDVQSPREGAQPAGPSSEANAPGSRTPRSSPPSAGSNPHAGHRPSPAAGENDPHAGHDMSGGAAPEADPNAGHDMAGTAAFQPEAQSDAHAGHDRPGVAATPRSDPHAGHNMSGAAASQGDPHAGHDMSPVDSIAIAPPPSEALSGPPNAADVIYDPNAMAASRASLRREHGGLAHTRFLVDRLEYSASDGERAYAADTQFWWGGDIDKLWIELDAEGEVDGRGEVEVQALWSRAIDPWFDLQVGVRQDLRSGPDRTHLVVGLQGLAPYWFELDGSLFLSNRGELTARFEAEYDLRITQRWVLQPRAEVEASLQDIPELEVGAGLTRAEIGARLRYEFRPEFAPYLGVSYARAFGETAHFRRDEGASSDEWSVILGVRSWF